MAAPRAREASPVSVTSTPARVMRSFTRGLKIPALIGKFADGTRIWGGPYTMTQFSVALGTLVTGYLTMGLWEGLLPKLQVIPMELQAYAVLVGVAVGFAWLTGKIPQDTNPAHAVSGLATGGRPARYGTRAGKAIAPLPRPRTFRARVLIPVEDQTPPVEVASLREELRAAGAPRPASTVRDAPRRGGDAPESARLLSALRGALVHK